MGLAIGFLLGAVIGYLAFRAGALSLSGALAATLTGGLIFGLGGLTWAVLLLAFFISSSLLSHTYSARKAALSEKFSKGSRRDWEQVFANGGLGAIAAVVHALFPNHNWQWLIFAGAMAAVNADTWATELGVLSHVPPRLISNWKIVERGTSGGVTLFGTLAASSGAFVIGLLAALFGTPPNFLIGLLIITLAGLCGALFDSWLGATVQAIYYCPHCLKDTERHPLHSCGTATNQIRGWHWLNNDIVNFICSIVGGLVTLILFLLMSFYHLYPPI